MRLAPGRPTLYADDVMTGPFRAVETIKEETVESVDPTRRSADTPPPEEAPTKGQRPTYESPRIIARYDDTEFVDKELPFVGATSVYKTYVPTRRDIQL